MEFIDVITKRYSVRGYLDKEVEKEKNTIHIKGGKKICQNPPCYWVNCQVSV